MYAPTAKEAATFILGLLIATFLGGSTTRADRGAVPPVGKVGINEPAQRAIIAHNGAEEILILETDVNADKETKVVEFMPLPSKPDVSLAPKGCFEALAQIIKQHELRYEHWPRNLVIGSRPEAVKIVVFKKLGAHEVTVAEVGDADEFVRWIRAFFSKHELGEPDLGEGLPETVADYLKRHFKFFAFDVVTLSPETQTVDPLVYQFKTDHLYYPLKVTNLWGMGPGTVELFVVLPPQIKDTFWEIRISGEPPKLVNEARKSIPYVFDWFGYSNVVQLSDKELAGLHPAIVKRFEGKTASLGAVRYFGWLKFKADMWIPARPYWGLARRFLDAFHRRDPRIIDALTDVPFAFDRKAVYYDKRELVGRFERLFAERPVEAFDLKDIQAEAVGKHTFDHLFDRKFAKEHLPSGGLVLTATVNGEPLVLLVRQSETGLWHIVGFSD